MYIYLFFFSNVFIYIYNTCVLCIGVVKRIDRIRVIIPRYNAGSFYKSTRVFTAGNNATVGVNCVTE